MANFLKLGKMLLDLTDIFTLTHRVQIFCDVLFYVYLY
jgi:hypothetical protein